VEVKYCGTQNSSIDNIEGLEINREKLFASSSLEAARLGGHISVCS
jgi:hypothetical protein